VSIVTESEAVSAPEARCEGCRDYPHPGIIWKPHDLVLGRLDVWWVQRCDGCATYATDLQAAQALAALKGYHAAHLDHPSVEEGDSVVFTGCPGVLTLKL
jgi:hypothetical protein